MLKSMHIEWNFYRVTVLQKIKTNWSTHIGYAIASL